MPKAPCSSCGCATRHSAPRPRALACADPATCWIWNHDCYAKRLRSRSRRAMSSSAYAPATLAGAVVPQTRIAA